MTRTRLIPIFTLLALAVLLLTGFGHDVPFWSEWGSNAQHTGMVDVYGQPLNNKLADIVYDPFVTEEKNQNAPVFGEATLSAHYQSTLIDGNSFYMVRKTGNYVSCHPLGSWELGANCGPNAWNQLRWNVARYDWVNGLPVNVWTFHTDWTPPTNATDFSQGFPGLVGWEPVFHPALAHGHLYVPGAGGTIWKVDTSSGKADGHFNPFSAMSIDPANTFVAGPLTANEEGDVYYNAIQLSSTGNPWRTDVVNAWLVKVDSHGASSTVTFAALLPDAPPGDSTNCPGTFTDLFDNGKSLPWPPKTPPTPPTELGGSQRPGLNIAPAIGPDGTVYTASVAHFDKMVAYLIAVNPDLTLKWSATLQNRLTDGCGVLLPIAPRGDTTMPNSCRFGTKVGIDPATNAYGSGYIRDQASSSPAVLPDGSIVFAVVDDYNFGRGHLMHFDPQGNYLNAYSFGWDSTPAVYTHDNTFSLVIKDNHYPGPAYCGFPKNPVCASRPEGPYLLSQIDANMNLEWSFENTTIDQNHPNGYEWCVNAPVVDRAGIVYGNSEDGNVYSIPQGHKGTFTVPKQKIFLLEALGAAYTPLAIGEDGKIYS